VALTADKVQPTSVQSSDAWLEAAFMEHWNRVYAVLYRLVGERDEAEDLALETFWRLHSRRARLQDEPGLAGWLYRVATNLGLNALRARQRRWRYEAQAGRQAISARHWDDPAEAVEKAQERQQVQSVLARMKPRSARLLVLRHSGLSYAEIAAALQVNLRSVGTLLARAEKEFEDKYQALEGDRHASG
jgi:RNA polymerase sigma-70 factor (ECF subfamily)